MFDLTQPGQAAAVMDADRTWLSCAFPGCDETVETGNVTRDKALDIMKEAVRRHYPDCQYAFGHGSALTGDYQPYSDLDVIVFAAQGDHWEVRHAMVDGFPVEFTVYTLETVDLMGFLALQLRLPLGLVAAEGSILADADGGASAFQARLAAFTATRSTTNLGGTIDRTRQQLLILLLDLQKNRSLEFARAVTLTAYPVLVRAVTLRHDVWQHRTKQFARNPEFPGAAGIARLHAAIAGLMHGDVAAMRAFVREAMDALGGALWDGQSTRQSARPEHLAVAQLLLGLTDG
jgi:hypothetical protein